MTVKVSKRLPATLSKRVFFHPISSYELILPKDCNGKCMLKSNVQLWVSSTGITLLKVDGDWRMCDERWY